MKSIGRMPARGSLGPDEVLYDGREEGQRDREMGRRMTRRAERSARRTLQRIRRQDSAPNRVDAVI
jgi:hypothetical protein